MLHGPVESSPPATFILDTVADDGAARLRDQRVTWSVAGLILSLLFHFWLGATVSGWKYEAPLAYNPDAMDADFDTQVVSEDEVVKVIPTDLGRPDDQDHDQRVGVDAMSLGAVVGSSRQAMNADLIPLVAIDPTRTRAPGISLPEGLKVSERLVVPGTTGEGLIQINAALDRVTWEIAGHLQERKVLIVWLLDASQSLTEQRLAVQKRLKRIYGELDALEAAEKFANKDRPLLSGVVAFGQGTQFLTAEPTEKFLEVDDAFAALRNDPTGVENVFGAISQVMDRWSKYRTDQGRRILLVTVTDEAGDDHGRPLDLAIAKCRRYGALAYVIGPASPFGKRQGYVPYIAPEDSKTYQLPVDLGPESVVVENVVLPFWYNGPQHDYLSSGFGPYALSRLVRETGGVYFRTNMTTMAGLATIGDYDPHIMKAFEPDYGYGSPQEFLQDIARHPIRAAVFAAAQYSQATNLKASGTPPLSFVLNPNNFRTVFSEAQKSAAVSQLAADSILSKMPANVDKFYDAEPSPRWRLAFDLNYGRLLAQKVRAMEYNSALAQLKGSYTDDDVAKRVNRVSLRPDRNVNYAGGLQKLARNSEEHLNRVISEAPGTPWAVLAARELRDGCGIRVTEQYVAPPPPPKPNNNPPPQPKARPKFAPEPPGPPPKPQAPKPPPQLPKL